MIFSPRYLYLIPGLVLLAIGVGGMAWLWSGPREVMSDLAFRTAPIDRTIFAAVVEAARRHGRGRVAVEDPVSGALSYRKLLAGACVLGEKLSAFARAGEAIGVMLPNSNGAAVTLIGLLSAGRVPAMINFTAGEANILSACAAAETTTLVTARAFISTASPLRARS